MSFTIPWEVVVGVATFVITNAGWLVYLRTRKPMVIGRNGRVLWTFSRGG